MSGVILAHHIRLTTHPDAAFAKAIENAHSVERATIPSTEQQAVQHSNLHQR
jgi:hypothetical protein